jgi:CheY-like chemotaxis protein
VSLFCYRFLTFVWQYLTYGAPIKVNELRLNNYENPIIYNLLIEQHIENVYITPLNNYIMLKRILVLDDNQDILDTINEALSYEKFEVKAITGSEHIIDILQGYKPDLVILDYKLNGPNGCDICNLIKVHPQLAHLPVIICSAYLKTNPLTDCNCDATIAKPFGLNELIDKVSKLLLQAAKKEKTENINTPVKKWAHIETY